MTLGDVRVRLTGRAAGCAKALWDAGHLRAGALAGVTAVEFARTVSGEPCVLASARSELLLEPRAAAAAAADAATAGAVQAPTPAAQRQWSTLVQHLMQRRAVVTEQQQQQEHGAGGGDDAAGECGVADSQATIKFSTPAAGG